MHVLIAISGVIEGFISWIGKLAAWLLLPMMAVIVVDVITRKFNLLTNLREYFENAGNETAAHFIESYLTSTKFQELEWHFHAALFLLCLGYGYVKNSHVRIEIVRERFSTETKAWLEFLGCIIFVFPYAFLVMWFGYDFAERSFNVNEVSSALTGLSHRWIIKAFVPIGMVLLMIATVAVLLRNFVYLFGDEAAQRAAQDVSPELHDAAEELAKLQQEAGGAK